METGRCKQGGINKDGLTLSWGQDSESCIALIVQMMCILGFRRKPSGSVGLGLERKALTKVRTSGLHPTTPMVSRCEIIRVCLSAWGKKWTDLTNVSELTGADGY